MKRVIKICFILIILLYLLLFASYKNGYYRDVNKEKKILTDEKIKEYENDLKNGVDVSKKEYVIIVPDYDNTYTRLALKISKYLENGFDKTIRYFFHKLGEIADE